MSEFDEKFCVRSRRGCAPGQCSGGYDNQSIREHLQVVPGPGGVEGRSVPNGARSCEHGGRDSDRNSELDGEDQHSDGEGRSRQQRSRFWDEAQAIHPPTSIVKAQKAWYVYLLTTGSRTYVGASVDPARRLRQHNREIKGGARATASEAPNWCIAATVHVGAKIKALSLEWHAKRAKGLKKRLELMQRLCAEGDYAMDRARLAIAAI